MSIGGQRRKEGLQDHGPGFVFDFLLLFLAPFFVDLALSARNSYHVVNDRLNNPLSVLLIRQSSV